MYKSFIFSTNILAHVGLYPRDLADRNIKYVTFTKPFADNDRSVCEGSTDGFVKVHVKEGSDTILGCTSTSLSDNHYYAMYVCEFACACL
jgi:pyruvate/2-oxoglutarate dehydrogenase complex dihydrolipoamide dehydrogenase (E3) component